MESLSLSTVLSAPSPLQIHPKTLKLLSLHRPNSPTPDKLPPLSRSKPLLLKNNPPLLSLPILGLLNAAALPCSAADATDTSARINLEGLLVSIDDFFNRNPFVVAGCAFVWLVVIPTADYYLKSYKYASAIDAFRKLRDDPAAALLDIREPKSVAAVPSPSLQYVKKAAVQVPFDEGDEEVFVKKVKERFRDPSNTVVCILDNFDGSSMRVAELLFKNGFKEAYAIKDGVRGKKGWLAVQESLLPPTVHMRPKKKKGDASEGIGTNGAVAKQSGRDDAVSSLSNALTEAESQTPGAADSNNSAVSTVVPDRVVPSSSSSSPYANYPDLKPPTSPTPSKPKH